MLKFDLRLILFGLVATEALGLEHDLRGLLARAHAVGEARGILSRGSRLRHIRGSPYPLGQNCEVVLLAAGALEALCVAAVAVAERDLLLGASAASHRLALTRHRRVDVDNLLLLVPPIEAECRNGEAGRSGERRNDNREDDVVGVDRVGICGQREVDHGEQGGHFDGDNDT